MENPTEKKDSNIPSYDVVMFQDLVEFLSKLLNSSFPDTKLSPEDKERFLEEAISFAKQIPEGSTNRRRLETLIYNYENQKN